MGFKSKILAQVTPGTTNATLLYQLPNAATRAIIHDVKVVETQGLPNAFSVFLDQDGVSTTQNESLYYESLISGGQSHAFSDTGKTALPMNDFNGSLYGQVDTAGNITFTVYGTEYLIGDIDNEVWDKSGGVFKPRYDELYQVRPAGGDYVPFNITGPGGTVPTVADETLIITDIYICNTSVNNATYFLYHDSDGEVFDINSSIDAGDVFKNSTVHLANLHIALTPDDAFAVASSISATLNFTIYVKREPLRSL